MSCLEPYFTEWLEGCCCGREQGTEMFSQGDSSWGRLKCVHHFWWKGQSLSGAPTVRENWSGLRIIWCLIREESEAEKSGRDAAN